MTSVMVRVAQAGDGPALARMHQEFAAYYVRFAPRHFQMPDIDGLAEEIDRDLETGDADALHLVAEAGGEVGGALFARFLPPMREAARQIDPDFGEPRVRIEYLVTSEAHRNQGLATALVQAAENWGCERGATISETRTYHRSPTSVPFWEAHMGYEERYLGLRKLLS